MTPQPTPTWDSHPIPPRLWHSLLAFLGDVRSGRWPGGAQVILNVSGAGIVTSLEVKGRDVAEAPVETRGEAR